MLIALGRTQAEIEEFDIVVMAIHNLAKASAMLTHCGTDFAAHDGPWGLTVRAYRASLWNYFQRGYNVYTEVDGATKQLDYMEARDFIYGLALAREDIRYICEFEFPYDLDRSNIFDLSNLEVA